MDRNFANIQEASRAAAKFIIDLAQSAVKDKGFFTLVLAGGSTPRVTYEMLSEPANAEQMPWQQTHFFWGDERWVAATQPESNFAMAKRTLLSKVHIPQQNIHPITTNHSSPEIAAESYEKYLYDFFYSKRDNAIKGAAQCLPPPSFDLILLGMGADGHTVSLFPGSDLLEEKEKWVAAVAAKTGTPPLPRITLTLPVLNQAQNILFLISGSRKKAIRNIILAQPREAEKLYPAARIKPVGRLIWLTAENP